MLDGNELVPAEKFRCSAMTPSASQLRVREIAAPTHGEIQVLAHATTVPRRVNVSIAPRNIQAAKGTVR